MSDKILICENGQLDKSTMTLLSKKGVIVIQCKDPDKVKLLSGSIDIESNDLFMSALLALAETSSDMASKRFVVELNKRLKTAEELKSKSITQ